MPQTSNVTWLHISDWHQHGSEFDRELVRTALVSSIQQRQAIDVALAKIDFIVFTGDLAYSGQPDEYKTAVAQLLQPVMRACGFDPVDGWGQVFTVPGNHDLDRSLIKELTPPLSMEPDGRKVLNALLANKPKRAQLLEAFQAYEQFYFDYVDQAGRRTGTQPAFYTVDKLDIEGRSVSIIGLNSALLSGRNRDSHDKVNDYGYLALGEQMVLHAIEKSEKDVPKPDLRIAIMHHPLNWLCEYDRVMAEERLTRACHFVLHGHEHMPRIYVADGTAGSIITIPGGASWNRRRQEDPRYTNAYNLVNVDFVSGTGTVFMQRWIDQHDAWEPDTLAAPGGRFGFVIPKSVDSSPEKGAAFDEVRKHYLPAIKRRFCERLEVTCRQTVERHSGHELVRFEARFTITIGPGSPEVFKLRFFANKRVVALVQAGDIQVEPCTITAEATSQHFEVTPMPDGGALCAVPLGPEMSRIELTRVTYNMVSDVDELRLDRVTRAFRMFFRKANELDYEFAPTGGFPRVTLRNHAMYEDIAEVNVESLRLPEEGYIVQWYPKLTAAAADSRSGHPAGTE